MTNDSPHQAADCSSAALHSLPRRRFMHKMAAVGLVTGFPAIGHGHGIGLVKPPVVLPPGVIVLRSDGMRMPLHTILQGRTTALQLMFTGCSETCPLQGALFANLQQRLHHQRSQRIQLLSLSIDPMDDAKSLSSWLRRFKAGKDWIAAVPASKDIDALRAVLQAGATSSSNHSSQVFFIDRRGQLVWRSEDLPPVEVIVRITENIPVT